MNSQELKNTQDTIEQIIILKIQEPIKDWTLINTYLKVLKDIDSNRRKQWHNEKFKVYEDIAQEFCADDIPF